ncbi:MAG TPA: NADH-ubiquinone oxidoreductase-F iron-sulfur binding region domain-containing protein [Acidimicrobiales bacterium]|nr:NADH-ubiquinone oxidoreductase-F iron-sulfur binding region domain-containing protein [Acidimicrobiales bacterium]
MSGRELPDAPRRFPPDLAVRAAPAPADRAGARRARGEGLPAQAHARGGEHAGHEAEQAPDPRRLPRLLVVEGREDLRAHLARLGPMDGARGGAHHGSGRPGAPDLVATVEDSGLVGRGGAGFVTGRKLRAVSDAAARIGRPPIVVVNAMEGEPASAKDRVLLLRAPHLVLDGAIAAAQALGALEVVVCVPRTDHTLPWARRVPPEHGAPLDADSGEGPGGPGDHDRSVATELAAHSLQRALDERRRAGSDRIPVTVARPPESYVSGEASALVRWLGGGPALPAFSVVRTAESGVSGAPTLLDNAETFAHLALVARFGAAWFRALGTDGDPGSALVTISGAVGRPGVAEIPLGSTVGDLLHVAGGPTERLQAVLLGGYGGSWVPVERALAVPLGHGPGSLPLGPGIVVALPGRACGLAETARLARFMANEGAGQCGPCAYGLPALASALEELAWPSAASSASAACASVARWTGQIAGRGACGHPDGAVRMVRSAITTFGKDLDLHAAGHGCEHNGRSPLLPVPPRRRAGDARP